MKQSGVIPQPQGAHSTIEDDETKDTLRLLSTVFRFVNKINNQEKKPKQTRNNATKEKKDVTAAVHRWGGGLTSQG